MFAALGALGSAAMPYLSGALGTVGGWLGSAGSWIGSNLAGIGSMLGGAGGALGSLLGQKKSKDSTSKLARLQYQYQKQGWLEGPSLQRQGLEDAGYNPLLALGSSSSYQASLPSGHRTTPDIAGSAKALSELGKDILGQAKATVENIKADTKLKEKQLGIFDAQKARLEQEASLLHSQTDRTDLAYGRDIADTITSLAGTGASLYSAKAMSDTARQNARTNARNATVNERKLDSHTSEIYFDRKGNAKGSVERSTFSHGVPSVDHSANPNIRPNAAGDLGSSASSAGRIAKEVAEELLLSLPAGFLGSAAGAGMAPVREREVKEHIKKSKDKSRRWYHNFDRFHFDY